MNLIKSASKTLIVAALASTTLFAASSQAASKIDPIVEDKLVKICEAIRDDNKVALRKAVKASRLSYRKLDKGLVCNGQDMMTFAARHNAIETSQYLARRTGQSENALTAAR